MPCPTEVPRAGPSRSIAWITDAWSEVGASTDSPASENATTPITTPGGWRSTIAFAAALAASSRVGWTSSAAMLPETSNVSMIVPSTRGRATVACGRAIAIANSTRAAMTSTAAPGRPSFRRRSRDSRLRSRAALAATRGRSQPAHPAQRGELPAPAHLDPARGHDEERDEPDREQHERPEERHARFRLRSRRSIAIRTIARTRSDSVERVTASTPARRNDAAIRASRASAAARNRRRNPASPVST